MTTATLHTTESFFAHVQAHGFNGIVPGPRDYMGDQWSRAIGDLFDRTAAALGWEKSQRRHTTWLIFQWLYCELAGQRSRVVASPPAIRAAGIELTDEIVSDAIAALLESQNH